MKSTHNSGEIHTHSESKGRPQERINEARRHTLERSRAHEKLSGSEVKRERLHNMHKKMGPINKERGCARENKVEKKLTRMYPNKKGYELLKERYLRNKEGKISVDPETKKGRRIDFVVSKGDRAVKCIEVTSKNAPKNEQIAKENRIRKNGGTWIEKKPNDRPLINVKGVKTIIDREK